MTDSEASRFLIDLGTATIIVRPRAQSLSGDVFRIKFKRPTGCFHLGVVALVAGEHKTQGSTAAIKVSTFASQIGTLAFDPVRHGEPGRLKDPYNTIRAFWLRAIDLNSKSYEVTRNNVVCRNPPQGIRHGLAKLIVVEGSPTSLRLGLNHQALAALGLSYSDFGVLGLEELFRHDLAIKSRLETHEEATLGEPRQSVSQISAPNVLTDAPQGDEPPYLEDAERGPYRHFEIIHEYAIRDVRGHRTDVKTAERVEILKREVTVGGSYWESRPRKLKAFFNYARKGKPPWKGAIPVKVDPIKKARKNYQWDTHHEPALLRGEEIWFLTSFELKDEFKTRACRDSFHSMQRIGSFTWAIGFPRGRPAKRWWGTVEYHPDYSSNETLVSDHGTIQTIKWPISNLPKGTIYSINWEW